MLRARRFPGVHFFFASQQEREKEREDFEKRDPLEFCGVLSHLPLLSEFQSPPSPSSSLSLACAPSGRRRSTVYRHQQALPIPPCGHPLSPFARWSESTRSSLRTEAEEESEVVSWYHLRNRRWRRCNGLSVPAPCRTWRLRGRVPRLTRRVLRRLREPRRRHPDPARRS